MNSKDIGTIFAAAKEFQNMIRSYDQVNEDVDRWDKLSVELTEIIEKEQKAKKRAKSVKR